MAPKFIGTTNDNELKKKDLNFYQINKKLKEYQKFIKKNFDYVEKILLMRHDQFIIIPKKEKRDIWYRICG